MKHASNRRLIITKNLIMMLVMVVVITLSVWSWFTVHNSVSADGMSVKVKASNEIQLALPYSRSYSYPDDYLPNPVKEAGHKFKQEIIFDDSQIFSDYQGDSEHQLDLFRDTTSGGDKFIVPTFLGSSISSGKTVNADGAYSIAKSSNDVLKNDVMEDNKDYNYLSFDFFLRSPTKTFSIGESSYVASKSELDNEVLRLADADNSHPFNQTRKSANGTAVFSADAIVGAIRTSITYAPLYKAHTEVNGVYTDYYDDGETTTGVTNYSSASSLGFLWLPRPDLYLNTGDSFDNFSLTKGVSPTSELAAKTYRHTFYDPRDDYWDDGIYKEVKKTVYYDSQMEDDYNLSGASLNRITTRPDGVESANFKHPGYFHVSKVDTSKLNDKVYYPTLGTNARVADNARNTITMKNSSNVDTEYYIYKCTLNIWIEGMDAEARRTMSDGRFQIFLNFKP